MLWSWYGIGVVDVLRHRPLLRGRLGVLLAEVPVQRQAVAEARDQLAQIQLALGPEIAAVERLLDRSGRRPAPRPPAGPASACAASRPRRRRRARVDAPRAGRAARRRLVPRAAARALAAASRIAARVVVVLVLLQLEVQVEPLVLRVVEDDLPLVELRDVVVELVVARRRTARRCRRRRRRCTGGTRMEFMPLRREIVQRADQALALAVLPRRIAGRQSCDVRRVGVNAPSSASSCCRSPRTRAASPASRAQP